MRISKFHITFIFLAITAFILGACSKEKDCNLENEYIYEALIIDENCNCIVSGKIKYLENCQTVALVDYGNGECDNIATKTICVNGKCETSAGAFTQEFEIDCASNLNNPLEVF